MQEQLKDAGFSTSEGVFLLRDICIILLPSFQVYAKGIEEDDSASYLEHVDINSSHFIVDLLDWIQCQSNKETPGFTSDDDDDVKVYRSTRDLCVYDLLDEDINASPHRNLMIYTWGKKTRKSVPEGSQHTFDACCLGSKKRGLNIGKYNGLDEKIQQAIFRAASFSSFVNSIVEKVEKENLDCISIVCTKGKHRSVATAELIRQLYPLVTIRHLNKHLT